MAKQQSGFNNFAENMGMEMDTGIQGSKVKKGKPVNKTQMKNKGKAKNPFATAAKKAQR